MANRTVKDAHSIRGTNPQYLVEKIIRSRIYDSRYWKEECFALTAELLVDKAMELKFIGGVFGGNIKPTPYLCLILKMLQIQPEKDIIVEFIRQEDYKYVRALGALYMRLTGTSLDCYKYLEPLYNDYRKVRRQNRQGGYEVLHMDEFIDELLREERICDIILPRIQKRQVLEEMNDLELRMSALDDLDEVEEEMEEENQKEQRLRTDKKSRRDDGGDVRKVTTHRRGRSPQQKRAHSPLAGGKRRSRSRDRHRRRSRSRDRKEKRREHKHSRDHSPGHDNKREKKHKSSKHSHSKEKRKDHGGGGDTIKASEIAEANALRARLGLPPLRT